MGPLIIEILDRFGKVRERHHVNNYPCLIGRGYDNDIIIDDPYISPDHLSVNITENKIEAQDTNSTNGLFSVQPFKKQNKITIENDSRIRIGHTDIRFRFADHPVKETIQDRDKPSQLTMLLTSGFILPIVWLIFTTALVINNYIEETDTVNIQSLLSDIYPLMIVLFLWALAWSIASKFVTHRFYFAFHAIWVCSLTFISIIVENLAQYFEFSFSLSGSATLISLTLSVLVTTALLYGHLHYSTTLAPAKAKRISLFTSLIIIGLVEIGALLNKPGFSNLPDYSGVIRPEAFRIAPAQSVTDFFENTKTLKVNIDKTVEEHNSEK